MSKSICKFCKRPIEWQDQKKSYGYVIRAGHSADIAKSMMPGHWSCVKIHLPDKNAPQEEKTVTN